MSRAAELSESLLLSSEPEERVLGCVTWQLVFFVNVFFACISFSIVMPSLYLYLCMQSHPETEQSHPETEQSHCGHCATASDETACAVYRCEWSADEGAAWTRAMRLSARDAHARD